jgi:hypothetical protein
MKLFFWISSFILMQSAFSQIDSTFQLCGTGSKKPYYFPELRHRGGFREIKQHFYLGYDKSVYEKVKNNSGIVRIQFAVNCKGESGQFKIEVCDFNYKISTMHATIIEQLLFLTKALNGWLPAHNDKGEAINSHKFFAFKIENGSIVDILPK